MAMSWVHSVMQWHTGSTGHTPRAMLSAPFCVTFTGAGRVRTVSLEMGTTNKNHFSVLLLSSRLLCLLSLSLYPFIFLFIVLLLFLVLLLVFDLVASFT